MSLADNDVIFGKYTGSCFGLSREVMVSRGILTVVVAEKLRNSWRLMVVVRWMERIGRVAILRDIDTMAEKGREEDARVTYEH